ncbi:MAG: hypothetical protein MZV70_73815 [Desulfobacterales bacterium]|nr:hypothetical protein [Desulfobacterales bacterium]
MSRDFLLLTPIEDSSLTQNITETLRTRVFSQLGQLALKYVKTILDMPGLVFFREDNGSLRAWAKSSIDLEITEKENAAATWTLNNGEVSGAGTQTYARYALLFHSHEISRGNYRRPGDFIQFKRSFPGTAPLAGDHRQFDNYRRRWMDETEIQGKLIGSSLCCLETLPNYSISNGNMIITIQ